jgi:preprotein translocase SecE subunit
VANKMAEKKKEERRDSRTVKQTGKQAPGRLARLRRNRLIAFFLESYRELRYKVTWPTFPEARNMTFVVIVLSAAVAAVLALADLGLFKLFQLISGQ